VNDSYLCLMLIHIVSATVLFGTGLGTAFQMWMANRSGDVRTIATVAGNVVIADYLFTTPAVIIQPISGIALIWIAGYDPFSSWLVAVYLLYVLAGICWMPVVAIQVRLRNIARDCAAASRPLPAEYHRQMRQWTALGVPAFSAVLAIFWLMVTKPALW
jgi:uncharacterized membrane protein